MPRFVPEPHAFLRHISTPYPTTRPGAAVSHRQAAPLAAHDQFHSAERGGASPQQLAHFLQSYQWRSHEVDPQKQAKFDFFLRMGAGEDVAQMAGAAHPGRAFGPQLSARLALHGPEALWQYFTTPSQDEAFLGPQVQAPHGSEGLGQMHAAARRDSFVPPVAPGLESLPASAFWPQAAPGAPGGAVWGYPPVPQWAAAPQLFAAPQLWGAMMPHQQGMSFSAFGPGGLSAPMPLVFGQPAPGAAPTWFVPPQMAYGQSGQQPFNLQFQMMQQFVPPLQAAPAPQQTAPVARPSAPPTPASQSPRASDPHQLPQREQILQHAELRLSQETDPEAREQVLNEMHGQLRFHGLEPLAQPFFSAPSTQAPASRRASQVSLPSERAQIIGDARERLSQATTPVEHLAVLPDMQAQLAPNVQGASTVHQTQQRTPPAGTPQAQAATTPALQHESEPTPFVVLPSQMHLPSDYLPPSLAADAARADARRVQQDVDADGDLFGLERPGATQSPPNREQIDELRALGLVSPSPAPVAVEPGTSAEAPMQVLPLSTTGQPTDAQIAQFLQLARAQLPQMPLSTQSGVRALIMACEGVPRVQILKHLHLRSDTIDLEYYLSVIAFRGPPYALDTLIAFGQRRERYGQATRQSSMAPSGAAPTPLSPKSQSAQFFRQLAEGMEPAGHGNAAASLFPTWNGVMR